jgi:hypothetical protein
MSRDESTSGRDVQVITSSPFEAGTTVVDRTSAFASALPDELAARTGDGHQREDNVVLGYD